MTKKTLDIQGHRGARGYLPENTIPAFVFALENGVKTLEMDVEVSSDGKLVVSHEPWMSADYCSHPDGTPVTEAEQMSLSLYKMPYEEIEKYDSGKRGNARFPQQKAMPIHKPLLSEVFDSIELITKQRNLSPVYYNIETKSTPEGDNVYNPAPAEFVKLLLDEINKHGINERAIFQSFDVRTLKETRKIDPKMKLALLVESGSLSSNLDSLGFTPEIYSPDFHLVNDSLVKQVHQKGMQLIPWTVNDSLEMKRLIELGADGFISDYPDMAVKISKEF